MLPNEIDWRQFVVSYPKASLLTAAAGGYFLGRLHGRRLVERASGLAADTIAESLDALAGRRASS